MLFNKIKQIWHSFRHLSGDDAYERYLKHHATVHQTTLDAPPALSRKDFFKLWQKSKWDGINRCC